MEPEMRIYACEKQDCPIRGKPQVVNEPEWPTCGWCTVLMTKEVKHGNENERL